MEEDNHEDKQTHKKKKKTKFRSTNEAGETDEEEKIKLNLRREFDPATDITCVAITKLFTKYPNAKIARKTTCTVNGEKINVGKLIYTLRTCFRNPKQNPLTKMRLQTLTHIKPLQEFLNMPILPKSKPNTLTTRICARIQKELQEQETKEYQLNIQIAQCKLSLAMQEQQLFTKGCQQKENGNKEIEKILLKRKL